MSIDKDTPIVSCRTDAEGVEYCCSDESIAIAEADKIMCRFPDGTIKPAHRSWSFFIPIIAAIAFAVMIAVNVLANILPIGGNTTGDVSNAYPNQLAPPAYTFLIWIAIYVLLGIMTIAQLVQKRSNMKNRERDVALVLIFVHAFNTLWIILWHYRQILLSLLCMVAIFVLLGTAYLRVHEQNNGLFPKNASPIVWIPVSVYFGWITIAFVANITTYLVSIGWNGGDISPSIWVAILGVMLVFIGIFVMSTKGDIPYVMVLVWAFIGILDTQLEPLEPISATAVTIGIVFLFFEIGFGMYRNIKNVSFNFLPSDAISSTDEFK